MNTMMQQEHQAQPDTAEPMVPAGYKQTEIGVIPEDWEQIYLRDIFEFKNGLNKSKEFFGYGTPIVNYMDVYENVCINSNNIKGKVFVSSVEMKNYSACKGDVFFTRTSETPDEIGLTSVLLDEAYNAVFSGFVLRARQKTDFLTTEFMKYCFRAEIVRKQIKSTASYTTRALTNGRLLSNVAISLPGKKEQIAIANALSDVDALLGSLEALIAKKQAIKTATMQQLLTGRTRLPPFSKTESTNHPDGSPKGYKTSELGEIPEDWEAATLGQISEVRMCKRVLSMQTSETGDIPFFKIGTFGEQPDAYIKYGVYEDFRKKYSFPKVGDILISAAGTLGKTVVYDGKPAYFQDSNIVWLDINKAKLLNEYLYHYYKVIKWASSEGSTIARLYNGIIRASLIALPSLQEQTAIATILSDMDEEIQALEQRLGKTRQLKQGMMQQLLTGKTRLI